MSLRIADGRVARLSLPLANGRVPRMSLPLANGRSPYEPADRQRAVAV
ncbi:MAG: hypothetical protein JWN10_240 [Solirubrobacterales bacterium]|nr:hypothetical protein [Solirubrobacterales bacterium]